jgi:outer membrane protein assembly factor BamB
MSRSVFAAVLSVAAGLASPAWGQDSWRQYAGNAERRSSTQSGPQDLSAVLWVVGEDSTGQQIVFEGQSSPVVYSARVFAVAKHYEGGSYVNDKLVAVDAASGEVVFQTLVEKAMMDSWSSPAIDQAHEAVIVASGYSVYGIDAAEGGINWQRPLEKRTVNASPVVAEGLDPGRVFVTDYDGYGTEGLLYCLNTSAYDVATNPYEPGEIVWQEVLGGTSGNTPAYHDGVVYVTAVSDPWTGWPGKGVIYAFDVAPPPEDRLRWSWTFGEGMPSTGFFGGLCLAEGYLYAATYGFYGTGDNSQLVKVRASDGELQWTVPCERTTSIPVVQGGMIYLSAGIQGYGSRPKIQAFEDGGTSAAKKWDTGDYLAVGGRTHQPVLSGHVLYTGLIPTTGSGFGPCAEFYMLDLERLPSDGASFVLGHLSGLGSSPACDGGRMYTIGANGLHALAARGDYSGDGRVSGEDVGGFLRAVLSGATTAVDVGIGDFDGDGQITEGDVAGFVTKLVS